jgi:acetyl esterase/lipase
MRFIFPIVLLALSSTAFAQESKVKTVLDLDYAGTGKERQKLNLYLPEKKEAKSPKLIVFIHGGGWEGGHRKDVGGIANYLVGRAGFAVASVGYRLTDEGIWPSQIHDCKAALRWLGKHADELGYDASKMGLFGISAGGHLVSLLGTSQGVVDLEGDLGEKAKAPAITCVANYCGPANFLTFPDKGSVIKENEPKGPIAKLFGGPMKDKLNLAKQASPITYVDKADPPFLHIHGTKDNLVPYAQVKEFDAALEKAGVRSDILTGEGGGHVFFSEDLMSKLASFFKHYLLDAGDAPVEGSVGIE